MTVQLYLGDCLEVMSTLADNSVDSLVTDPPYELGFMGKAWDRSGVAFDPATWTAMLRVAKPGAYLLAFGGTRTCHRIASAIEDGGWEIRDRFRFECGPETKYGPLWDSLDYRQRMALLELLNDQQDCGSELAWMYGSGFPKSLNVSKAIAKLNTEMRLDGDGNPLWCENCGEAHGVIDLTHALYCVDCAARQWGGWGTGLKPAYEPIIVARKPLIGTVAENVLAHGTGGLNIDGCRIEGVKGVPASPRRAAQGEAYGDLSKDPGTGSGWDENAGRWPANLIHDGSDEVLAAFPSAPGQLAKASISDTQRGGQNTYGNMARGSNGSEPRNDVGSAARFFYCAKASRKDRNEGLEHAVPKTVSDGRAVAADNAYQRGKTLRANHHPTVKPTDLMRYLCRLITPPGGTVLDPFMGSGSTGKAAKLEGFIFVGIERELEYWLIAQSRIDSLVSTA